MNFKCCIPCVPPERHPGCSGKCPKYKKCRDALDAENRIARLSRIAVTASAEAKFLSNMRYKQKVVKGVIA